MIKKEGCSGSDERGMAGPASLQSPPSRQPEGDASRSRGTSETRDVDDTSLRTGDGDGAQCAERTRANQRKDLRGIGSEHPAVLLDAYTLVGRDTSSSPPLSLVGRSEATGQPPGITSGTVTSTAGRASEGSRASRVDPPSLASELVASGAAPSAVGPSLAASEPSTVTLPSEAPPSVEASVDASGDSASGV